MPRLFLLTLILLSLKSSAQNLQQGLVACYSFSGNALDGSGNNNNGTLHGPTLTTDRFGVANSAYKFDGNSYISIPGSAMANPNYSYSVWIFLQSIPSYGDTWNAISIGDNIDSKHQTVNASNVYATAGATGLTSGGYNIGSPPTTGVQSGSLPNTNQWYHMVSVRDNNSITLYINGVLIGSSSTNSNLPYYGNSYANIGARCNLIQFFQGTIDDISIYKRPLTAQEVGILYNQGLACSVVPPPAANGVAICGSGSADLTASGGTTYRWYDSPSGNNIIYTGNPFTTPVRTITTDYYVSNVENNIESSRVKVTLTIFSQPQIVCNFPKDTQINKSENFSALISSGTPQYSYTFDFGDGTTQSSAQANLSHQYTSEGQYTVSISVSDVNLCKATCSDKIQAYSVKPPATNTITRCGSGSAVLLATGGVSYRWYDSEENGNLLYEGNPYITPETTKSVDYYVSNVESNKESSRVKIALIILPQPNISCTIPTDLLLPDVAKFSTDVTSGTGPYQYVFDFGNGTQQSTSDPTAMYAYTASGNYNVKITVSDINKCTDYCTKTIEVLENIFIPNVITADADTVNNRLTVFIKNGETHRTYMGSEHFKLLVYNRWSNQVFQTTDVMKGWNGEDVSQGTYYYLIKLGKRRYKGWVSVLK